MMLLIANFVRPSVLHDAFICSIDTARFAPTGKIGRFNLSELINALIAASVMMGVAQTIVVFVALYGMGLSSQLYMEFMRESVDWRKEYARFAAQVFFMPVNCILGVLVKLSAHVSRMSNALF